MSERRYKTNIGYLTIDEIERLLKDFEGAELVFPESGVVMRVKEKEELFVKHVKSAIPGEIVVDDRDAVAAILGETGLTEKYCGDGCPLKPECDILSKSHRLACDYARLPKVAVRVITDD